MSLAGGRLFAALSLAWSLATFALYAGTLDRLAPARLRALAEAGEQFFYWQAAGFLLVVVVAAIWRPGRLGRLTAVWLALSTGTLLALPRDVWLIVQFLAFAGWCLAAVRSTQLAIARFVGKDQATQGIAAATLYSAGLLIAFFLGLLRMLSLWPVLLVACLVALPGAIVLARRPLVSGRAALKALDRLNPLGAAALEAMWVSLALAFVWAISPEMFSDSIRSYLPDVQAMARHHSLAPQLVDFSRLLPRALQALCAMGYVVGSLNVAKWLSWFAMIPLAALISGEIQRRSGDANLGAVGAAIVVTCPLLLGLSTSLMYDHVMTMLCVAGFISLLLALSNDSRRGVLLSAFIMGAATSIKYNFLIFDLVWGLFLITHALRESGWRDGLRECIGPFSILGAAACPWYLYNWVQLGNPLFPFLNEIFRSPYWPAGVTTAINVDRFAFGEGIWSPLFFPWTVTFHTSRLIEGPDGQLGFALLALLPWIWAIRRGRGMGLGIAGLLIIAWVSSLMPYIRYWLPGLPLLLLPMILALGAGIDRAHWRLPRWAGPIAAAGLLAAFWVQIPFWTASQWRFPWPVYAGQITPRDWTERLFRGLPAVEELNRILDRRERVVATAYDGIYTVDGDAFELPFWHMKYHGIDGSPSFDAYLERGAIRYWVVDFTTSDFLYFNKMVDADERYWNAARLVAGHAGVGIFDVAKTPRPGYSRVESRQIHPTLDPGAEQRDVDTWSDPFADHAKKRSRSVRKGIAIPPRGKVEYLFSVASESSLLRLALELQSADSLRQVNLRVRWLDETFEPIGDMVLSRLRLRQLRSETLMFSAIPEGATYGRLTVSRSQRLSLRLRSLRLDFLAQST